VFAAFGVAFPRLQEVTLDTATRPARPRSLRLEQARALNARLRELMIQRRQNLAAIAAQLARMRRGRLFAVLGYASLAAYARAELGLGRSKVSELVGIVEASEALPAVREAFVGGRLEWTKAREVVKLATPETEAEWLARASGLSAQELRACRTGEPPKQTRVLSLSPEQTAAFDQLVAQVRDELGAVSDGEAVLELMRRGAGGGTDGPAKRTVISLCGECQRASSETREGPVAVRRSVVEAALCDGEVHDLREAENLITRTIPAKVRRRVLDRDRRRCRVPGCRFMSGLEVHHEDGWRAGHDPQRMVTLCGKHHRMRHEGELRIEGLGGGEFRFLLLDGTALGDAAFACENTASVAPGGPETGSMSPEARAGETAGAFACENTASVGPGGHESGSTTPAAQAGEAAGAFACDAFACETTASVGPGGHESGSTTPAAQAGEAAGAFARENGQRRHDSRARSQPDVLAEATRGLQRLGLRYREARRRAEIALDSGARSLADVFGQALRSMPLPG